MSILQNLYTLTSNFINDKNNEAILNEHMLPCAVTVSLYLIALLVRTRNFQLFHSLTTTETLRNQVNFNLETLELRATSNNLSITANANALTGLNTILQDQLPDMLVLEETLQKNLNQATAEENALSSMLKSLIEREKVAIEASRSSTSLVEDLIIKNREHHSACKVLELKKSPFPNIGEGSTPSSGPSTTDSLLDHIVLDRTPYEILADFEKPIDVTNSFTQVGIDLVPWPYQNYDHYKNVYIQLVRRFEIEEKILQSHSLKTDLCFGPGPIPNTIVSYPEFITFANSVEVYEAMEKLDVILRLVFFLPPA